MRAQGERKTENIIVDNFPFLASSPFDFTYTMTPEINNVYSVELVSMSMELPDIYVWLEIDFDSLETKRWPLFAQRDFDSPLNILPRNNYVALFKRPLLPKLSHLRIRLYHADGHTLYTPSTTVTPSGETLTTSSRVSLFFKVTYMPCREQEDWKYRFDGTSVEVQRDYWILDNRFTTIGKDSYDFVMPDIKPFRNIYSIKLKEASISRNATSHTYVVVKIPGLGLTFPLFYKYTTHGYYSPYELLVDSDFVELSFNPTLSSFNKGLRVQICDPYTDAILIPNPTDKIVALAFEVEYVPLLESKVTVPTKVLRQHVTVDNYDVEDTVKFIGGSTRYNFDMRLPEPMRNVYSIELKHMTFPTSCFDDQGVRTILYHIDVEFIDLGFTWTVPFGIWQNQDKPNVMQVIPEVHRKTLRPPRNIDSLHLAFFKSELVQLDGVTKTVRTPYVHPSLLTEVPLTMVLELAFDPRTETNGS